MLLKKEFTLLYYLLCHAESFESQRDLAKQLKLSLGNVNGLIKKAVDNGWIADKSLTPKGRRVLEPYKVDNAVIMAAGSGSRLAPLSYDKPKGLLVVKGEILIERQIRQLQVSGIQDIIVVVGYMKEKFFYLAEKFNVKIVINPDYYRYNNTSTLMCVLDSLKNTYICSSDNYFMENVFTSHVYRSYYAAVKAEGETDEYCIKYDRQGRICSVTIGGCDAWYMLGQAYFSRDFSILFKRILRIEYQRPVMRKELWENVYMQHVDALTLWIKKYPADKILEFDSLDELRAFDEFYINNVDSTILKNICRILKCDLREIKGIKSIATGLTNLSFAFWCRGKQYVYRHPGIGTESYINRKSEAFSMKWAQKLQLDSSYIYMDEKEGWKLSYYMPDAHDLDYGNSTEVFKALCLLRRLHRAKIRSPYSFDVWKTIQWFMKNTRNTTGDAYNEVKDLVSQMQKINALVKKGKQIRVLCHCDVFNKNFLVCNNGSISLIDWEYSGMDDPAFDIGIFLCCSGYSYTQVLETINMYLERKASVKERVHYIAYAALASFYYYVWTVYHESWGKSGGGYLYTWYKASRFFVNCLLSEGRII